MHRICSFHRAGGRSTGRRRQPHALAGLAAVATLLLTTSADARSPYPYAGEFHAQIDAAFFEPDHATDALPDPEKLRAYADYLREKRRFIEQHIYVASRVDEGHDAEDAHEEAVDSDITIALVECDRLLERLAETRDDTEAHEIAARILTLELATRSVSEPLGSIQIPRHLWRMVFEWRAPDRTSPRAADREAANLVDPETGLYFTYDELAELTRAGVDISTLDPPARSIFWRKKRDISAVDVVSNYHDGGDPLHEGMTTDFPPRDGAVFELNKVHMSQTKPKIDVYHYDPKCAAKSKKKRKKCRTKLKLKFGMETHADPPANALLSALGWNVDVSAHLRNAKVYLPDDYPLSRVENEWIGYFDRQRLHTYFPLDSVLSPGNAGRGRDENGDYLVFQRAVAEYKHDGIARIGYWGFSDGIASNAREARALAIFNVWIGNADMKDEGNNKVMLRKNEEDEWQMYLVMQDLGHALGWILPERVDSFPWDLVETGAFQRAFGTLNRSIELNYVDLQPTGLGKRATYADSRWMVRNIAQLTREQIEEAVALGDFPGHVGELYVEKLINRRNQLVEAFGLSNEFEAIEVDRHFTAPDGTIVDGEIVQGRYEGSPHNYSDHWRDLLSPVGSLLTEMLVSGFQAGIGAVDVVNPGNIEIGGNVDILPRVLLRVRRQVMLNPNPEGVYDQYIVVDTLRLGLRVGVGYIGSGEGTWLKKIVLAYPVSTRTEGVYAPIGALNFLREVESRKEHIPERYVMYREDVVKAGARVSSDGTDLLLPFGAEGSHNWVSTRRSVIDHRRDDALVWIDAPRSIDNDVGMYLQFFKAVQVPFFGGGTSHGSLGGQLFELDADRLEVLGENGEPIFDNMVFREDFSEIERIARSRPRTATSDFSMQDNWWSLIFLSWRTRGRHETISLFDPFGELDSREFQAERRSRFAWLLLDNGETQMLGVNGFLHGLEAADAKPPEPAVILSIDVDDLNTHSDELDSYYALLLALGFGADGLSPDFRAEDWEISGEADGLWSRLLTQSRVHLYAGALERLVSLDRERHFEILERRLGLPRGEFARHRWHAERGANKRSLTFAHRTGGQRLRRLVLRSHAVFDELEAARRAADPVERMKKIVDALYRANFRSADTFDPIVVASLLEQANVEEMVEAGELYVDSRITRAFEDEHNLPDRVDVVGRLGERRDPLETQYRFFPFGGIDVYEMLNWSRAPDESGRNATGRVR